MKAWHSGGVVVTRYLRRHWLGSSLAVRRPESRSLSGSGGFAALSWVGVHNGKRSGSASSARYRRIMMVIPERDREGTPAYCGGNRGRLPAQNPLAAKRVNTY